MPSRSFHAKSRNSCGRCKQRRVKCDQQAPICSNCRRRGETCDFQATPQRPRVVDKTRPLQGLQGPAALVPYDGDRPEALSIAGGSPFFFDNVQVSEPPTYWSFQHAMSLLRMNNAMEALMACEPSSLPLQWDAINSKLSTVPPSLSPMSWHSDLQSAELMHNFAHYTTEDIRLPGELSRSLWQEHMLTLSNRFPYLQHAVMAVSALHICHKRPPHPAQYAAAAYRNSIKASALCRTGVTEINNENWLAVTAFVVVHTLFEFDAAFLKPDGSARRVPEAVEIIRVLRRPANLLRPLGSWLFRSSLGQALTGRTQGHVQKLTERALKEYDYILEQMDALSKFFSESSSEELEIREDEREHYATAIQSLKWWTESCSGMPRTWTSLCGWPVMMSEKFIELLAREGQFAKVLCVYWCAVMNRTPKRKFFDGYLLSVGKGTVNTLDPKWNDLLKWPCNEMGIDTVPERDGGDGLVLRLSGSPGQEVGKT